jgi:putative transposase
MPQSLVQIYVHIVFSTQGRAPFLTDREVREDLHSYMSGICTNQESPAIEIGGVADHVHICCRLTKTGGIADLIRELKKSSSGWVKEREPRLSQFYWQKGYGAFSVSPSHLDGLVKYIQNQEEHHKHESFQDEFRRLCAKYGLKIDERYVWD